MLLLFNLDEEVGDRASSVVLVKQNFNYNAGGV
jgi:hypothetical protein